jgi:DNA-directed RNA polymerase specialized sigma24 family protein
MDEGFIGSGRRLVSGTTTTIDALDDLLTRLASLDPEASRIVDLRFFAGLSLEETAEVMGLSTAKVRREWSVAKAWFTREMGKLNGTEPRELRE